MVIQYEKQKVAFECDGEKYHQDIEKDMQRQAVLERLGWTFIRLRGSEYYIDKKAAMKRVINDLHELGIYPQSTRAEETHENDDLIVRVKRRANELQNEWMLEKRVQLNHLRYLRTVLQKVHRIYFDYVCYDENYNEYWKGTR